MDINDYRRMKNVAVHQVNGEGLKFKIGDWLEKERLSHLSTPKEEDYFVRIYCKNRLGHTYHGWVPAKKWFYTLQIAERSIRITDPAAAVEDSLEVKCVPDEDDFIIVRQIDNSDRVYSFGNYEWMILDIITTDNSSVEIHVDFKFLIQKLRSLLLEKNIPL